MVLDAEDFLAELDEEIYSLRHVEWGESMKTYKVKITETLEKEVEVEAEDRDEAEQIVSDAWHNSEYILDAEDFKGVTFKAEPPARKRESYERWKEDGDGEELSFSLSKHRGCVPKPRLWGDSP